MNGEESRQNLERQGFAGILISRHSSISFCQKVKGCISLHGVFRDEQIFVADAKFLCRGTEPFFYGTGSNPIWKALADGLEAEIHIHEGHLAGFNYVEVEFNLTHKKSPASTGGEMNCGFF